jgi:hypothetical protein
MRQLMLTVGVVCVAAGAAGWVVAQNPTMPGQFVGTGYTLSPVGQASPKVGQPIGQPINLPVSNPLMRPYDPSRPLDAFKGTNIDPKLVIAPTMGSANSNLFTRSLDQVKEILGLSKPVAPQAMVTPGIFRRSRERIEQRMWRRD